jgi:hypothetical protein
MDFQLSDFNVNPISDSTPVKTVIILTPRVEKRLPIK